MESGQGSTEGKDTIETDSGRKLVRFILIQALRDLGKGSVEEQESIISFCKSRRFDELCTWAGWETAWVRETFLSLNETHPSVRLAITKECVEMMKAIATFDYSGSGEPNVFFNVEGVLEIK